MKTQRPEAAKQARTLRGQKPLSSPELCTALSLAAAIAAGCTGVPVRPEPFKCPPGAVEAMERLGWVIGLDRFAITVDERGPSRGVHWFTPGPVVGVVPADATGQQKAPPGTLFYGRLYVTEKTAEWPLGEVIAVYDHVEFPGKGKFPVCVVADLNAVKELKDGTAKAKSVMTAEPVKRWAP